MYNKTLQRVVAILLCLAMLCGCAQKNIALAASGQPLAVTSLAAAAAAEQEGQPAEEEPAPKQETSDELVFIPLQDEPNGIAGLNPTSTVLLDRLEEESAARKAEIEAAEAAKQPAVATFNQSAGGNYSALVRQWRSNVNSDIRAWIRVPGTNINYAVCYHPDVDYYTHRGYYKESSYMGVIWTNGGTKFGTRSEISNNTVLYGHNWTNVSAYPRIASPADSMFAQLTGYHHLSVAQANPYIYYSTADENMTFKIFACFYTDLSFNYISTAGGQGIIEEAKRRSRHKFNVDVNSSDKILTLSTCTRAYGQTSNQRFVVMARLLRPGESVTPYTITANPNHKQPNVWR